MHISSNFGDGWARWWINNSKQQVRIKEDGAKYAKVKGIDVTVFSPGSAANKSRSASDGGLRRAETSLSAGRAQAGKGTPVKRVTGIRIEFKTEEEKATFISSSKKIQLKSIALPDL